MNCKKKESILRYRSLWKDTDEIKQFVVGISFENIFNVLMCDADVAN